MTHSLHRCGNEDSLKKDYIFLCTPAKGINFQGAAEKLKKILDIVLEAGPSNIGFYGYGSIISGVAMEEVKKNFQDNSRIRCSFDDKEKLKKVLRQIKNDDFGLSITVSGLISEIIEISRELELKPHTINISCGVFGKVDRLPPEEHLEISTMCGHGMISYDMIKDVINKLREGEISLAQAIKRIGEPCSCGIFNPTRALKILEGAISDTEKE